MPLPDFGQNGTFYAFYAPCVQRQTHVRVHTSRVTNFAFDTYPRKMHFERRTAQKLARTTFRVVPNCARGGGGWIKSSSSLASEASALAFGQPARFARGLDKLNLCRSGKRVTVKTHVQLATQLLQTLFTQFLVKDAHWCGESSNNRKSQV